MNLSNSSLPLQPILYREWLISTKIVDRQLWLRWQHPYETIARYGYPVTERGLADTIRYARYLIDLSIGLEEYEAEES
jgi:hypothetical protein